MRIVAISDTHGLHRQLEGRMPDGDVLVHAGDLTNVGKPVEVEQAGGWLREQTKRYQAVVFIAGNHDWLFETDLMKAMCIAGIKSDLQLIYLQNSGVTLHFDGKPYHFYGMPQQPEFCNWAFNVPRGEALRKYTDAIPDGTDVLITHGPPKYIFDQSYKGGEYLGCQDLRDAVFRVKPKVHIFGHIHGGYGNGHLGETTYVNAAVCNEAYRPVNKPQIIEI